MGFHFSAKGPCCLTRHNGLLAVKTLGWILIRVALSTQQDLVLGSKWFLHEWATALGTPEAPLMPVAAFVGQILGESKFMLVKTFIYSAFILLFLPETERKSIAVVDPTEVCSGKGQVLNVTVVTLGLLCRSLAEAIGSCFGRMSFLM